MAREEQQIIQLKYKSKRIGLMNDAEISLWSKALLVKIHAITGWALPDGNMLKIVTDQFQKKMIESYPDVNPDEIEYAFRQYGTKVKDWGKLINLSLIEEVMMPYLNDRHRVGHEVEERKDVPEQKIYTEKELDNLARYDAEMFYQRLRNGTHRKNELCPDNVTEILIKDGLIKRDIDLITFFKTKLENDVPAIYERVDK